MSTEPTAVPAPPLLRVVRGEPTPEQLAALVGVLAALSGGGAPAAEPGVSAWSAGTRRGRPAGRPGAMAWRLSMRPQ